MPAPATAELMKGMLVHSKCGTGERVTPTGAAIAASLAQSCEAMPALMVMGIGSGAGSRDFEDCANILRAFLGETQTTPAAEKLYEVSSNVDDVTGEVLGYTKRRLIEAGALDVWLTSLQMKKDRPGVQISFLCGADKLQELISLMMEETGTLGVRFHRVERIVQDRKSGELQTAYGRIRVKFAGVGGKPEYEDCAVIAKNAGVPLREVVAEAQALLNKGD